MILKTWTHFGGSLGQHWNNFARNGLFPLGQMAQELNRDILNFGLRETCSLRDIWPINGKLKNSLRPQCRYTEGFPSGGEKMDFVLVGPVGPWRLIDHFDFGSEKIDQCLICDDTDSRSIIESLVQVASMGETILIYRDERDRDYEFEIDGPGSMKIRFKPTLIVEREIPFLDSFNLETSITIINPDGRIEARTNVSQTCLPATKILRAAGLKICWTTPSLALIGKIKK